MHTEDQEPDRPAGHGSAGAGVVKKYHRQVMDPDQIRAYRALRELRAEGIEVPYSWVESLKRNLALRVEHRYLPGRDRRADAGKLVDFELTCIDAICEYYADKGRSLAPPPVDGQATLFGLDDAA